VLRPFNNVLPKSINLRLRGRSKPVQLHEAYIAEPVSSDQAPKGKH